MAIKIGNIGKFTLFPAGHALQLPGEEKRRVKLELNCEDETRLDVVQGDGAVTFLAKLEGHKTIEFIVDGPCEVVATSEGEVWLYTDEGQHIVYESDEPSFVTLDFERSPALTEFERMQLIANLKREQREEESRVLLAEHAAKIAELGEKLNASAEKPANPPSGGVGTAAAADSSEPKPPVEGADPDAGTPPGTSGTAKPAK